MEWHDDNLDVRDRLYQISYFRQHSQNNLLQNRKTISHTVEKIFSNIFLYYEHVLKHYDLL